MVEAPVTTRYSAPKKSQPQMTSKLSSPPIQRPVGVKIVPFEVGQEMLEADASAHVAVGVGTCDDRYAVAESISSLPLPYAMVLSGVIPPTLVEREGVYNVLVGRKLGESDHEYVGGTVVVRIFGVEISETSCSVSGREIEIAEDELRVVVSNPFVVSNGEYDGREHVEG